VKVAGWWPGRTENISYSGVLFRAEELINVNTPIELRVALSADTRERPHPEVFCHARIVRAVPPTPCRPRTRTRGRPWPPASSSTSSFLRRPERPDRPGLCAQGALPSRARDVVRTSTAIASWLNEKATRATSSDARTLRTRAVTRLPSG